MERQATDNVAKRLWNIVQVRQKTSGKGAAITTLTPRSIVRSQNLSQRMRRGLPILVILLLIPVSPLSISAQTRPVGLPKVVVNKTDHNFGEVFAGEELMAVFGISNVGSAPLELSDKNLTGRATVREESNRSTYRLVRARYSSAAPS